MSNHDLTRRLAKEANTSLNAAGNVIRKLVRDGAFSVEGQGAQKVLTRALI
ncbi:MULTISPECIES: hypothetical protein [unclassified Variovorax]|uniref:hypothetical protein n=1 Tax=unclassified Variovorax TaxID=663243 RepID=UPI000AE7D901|nr:MULTISPECIES: hypothetical protein [unclassified Variovorax]PNG56006.1 hypothetical protein CHC07_02420 [Variovorax sp. B4]PNG57430.1 hypothetical protein CHC06_02423 [Variovorax sp. B2]VTV10197.1 hypothetical protein WDL1CHR_01207 [Variovorax sp. WDL1]